MLRLADLHLFALEQDSLAVAMGDSKLARER
jgi:hypothetical protein